MKNTLNGYFWQNQVEQQHREGSAAGGDGGAGTGDASGTSSTGGEGGTSGDGGGAGKEGAAADGGKAGDGNPGEQGGKTVDTPVSLLGDDLGFVQGWQEKLPAELQATAANFKTLPDLVKSLLHTKQLASGKTEGMIKLPGENATPEEKAAFAKALGVPEKPEDYGFKKPDGEMGNFYNDEQVSAFGKVAVELGLSKAQADGLLQWQLGISKEFADTELEEGKKYLQERETKLKEAFGTRVDAEVAEAQRVLATMNPNIDINSVNTMDPQLVIGLASFAKKLSPDTLVTVAAMGNKLSPTSAATDIISNPNNPDYKAYWDPTHINHQTVKAKVLDGMKDR